MVMRSNHNVSILSEDDSLWLHSYGHMLRIIDGNPNLRHNGGLQGLAQNHCAGSLVNHSALPQNAKYVEKDFISEMLQRAVEENVEKTSGAVILFATHNIYPEEQTLTNYERHLAGDLNCALLFLKFTVSCDLDVLTKTEFST